jgi:hypothetical protein
MPASAHWPPEPTRCSAGPAEPRSRLDAGGRPFGVSGGQAKEAQSRSTGPTAMARDSSQGVTSRKLPGPRTARASAPVIRCKLCRAPASRVPGSRATGAAIRGPHQWRQDTEPTTRIRRPARHRRTSRATSGCLARSTGFCIRVASASLRARARQQPGHRRAPRKRRACGPTALGGTIHRALAVLPGAACSRQWTQHVFSCAIGIAARSTSSGEDPGSPRCRAPAGDAEDGFSHDVGGSSCTAPEIEELRGGADALGG